VRRRFFARDDAKEPASRDQDFGIRGPQQFSNPRECAIRTYHRPGTYPPFADPKQCGHGRQGDPALQVSVIGCINNDGLTDEQLNIEP
jgi:hypothetical protein